MGLLSADYDKQISVEKWERKKSRMVHTLWKETERKTVSGKQMLDAYLPPGAVVKAMKSRPRGGLLATQGHSDVWAGPLPRAMYGFLVLQQPGSVLIYMAPVALEGHADTSGLRPCCRSLGHAAAGAMLVWVAFATTWGHDDSQTWAAARDHV